MAQQRNSNSAGEQDRFSYEILKHYGILSSSARGWTREFNLVRWNERDPKYDLRDWSPDHGKMSKGITLTAEEVLDLSNLIEENLSDFTGELEESDDGPAGRETATVRIPEKTDTGTENHRSGSEPAEKTDTYAGELYEESA